MDSNTIREAYIALGGNIGDAHATLEAAVNEVANHPKILELSLSRFYITSPVSSIPQPDFVNAVCLVETTMDLRTLFNFLQSVEIKFGKTPNIKDAPRPIDLDILFFGHETCDAPDLKIPHPEWKNRLFVLTPLMDLTDKITVPHGTFPETFQTINLIEYMQTFTNSHNETLRVLN
ncbi:MAG: 2-amino-4-hydroxy-6-hydroxymethyldihydropteridine diphosphokinase [Parachlamydiaceae bacterium]|nr:2-amino-4-hydroxy-6-hydroxymethyldihydropteridine diphosphokinase [Parachlamydiaceae bacterium]